MISVPVTLDQLITVLKQLQPNERAQVAKVLIQEELRSDLADLIQELYNQPAIDDVSDSDIMAEIKAVRQRSSGTFSQIDAKDAIDFRNMTS